MRESGWITRAAREQSSRDPHARRVAWRGVSDGLWVSGGRTMNQSRMQAIPNIERSHTEGVALVEAKLSTRADHLGHTHHGVERDAKKATVDPGGLLEGAQ